MQIRTIYANRSNYERLPRCYGIAIRCLPTTGTVFASNSNHGSVEVAKEDTPVATLPMFDGCFYRFANPVDGIKISAGLDQPFHVLVLETPEEDVGDFRTLDYQGIRLAGAVVGPQAAGAVLVTPPVVAGGVDEFGTVQALPMLTDDADVDNPSQPEAVKVRKAPADVKAVEIYDSGAVAAGAEINTGNLDVSRFFQIVAVAVNASGVTARTLQRLIVRSDASAIYAASTGCAAGVTGAIIASRSSATVAAPINIGSGSRIDRFRLIAAGADAARLTVWGMP